MTFEEIIEVVKKYVQDPEVVKKITEDLSPIESYYLYLGSAIISLLIIVGVLSYITYKLHKEKKEILNKYSIYDGLVDLDSKIVKKQELITELDTLFKNLKIDFKDKKVRYDFITKELDVLDNQLYIPEFSFNTSTKYKNKINSLKESEKELIKKNLVIVFNFNLKINSSVRDGSLFERNLKQVVLNAFNGEFNKLADKVNVNNYYKSIEKLETIIEKYEDFLHFSGGPFSGDFINLKKLQLQAILEEDEFLRKEKERIKEELAIAREEEKAFRIAEKAIQKAEQDERIYQLALNKAREEMLKKSSSDRDKFEQEISELEAKLKEALSEKERAMSMAQQTKRGFVYVISNVGSFGENVFKIGLTRRLDPLDRVNELSGASVPFKFDVHALIFSEDAPKLEKDLHHRFYEQRVNKVNDRKEFFKVPFEEIKAYFKELNLDVNILENEIATEYFKTLTMENKYDVEESDVEI